MPRKDENSGFICANCQQNVNPIKKGSIRNHCPHCLCSIHVDNNIGDRQSDCGGLMPPIGLFYHSQKGYQLVQQCKTCGKIHRNILADDDNRNLIYSLETV